MTQGSGSNERRDMFKLAKNGAEFAVYADVFLGVIFADERSPKCLCPFHDEKGPSFSVNVKKNYGHCFGCGAHVDIIDFTAKIMGITALEAATKIVEDLAL